MALLGICSREGKTYVHTKTCRRRFIAVVSLTIPPPGTCPDVLPRGDGLKKLWYGHAVEYYSAVKRKGLLIHEQLE